MLTVKKPNDVPKGHHFQIITFETRVVNHEADERSKTHPGHGYPAYSESFNLFTIQVTTDREEFNRELTQLYKKDPKRTDVVALEVNKSIGVSIEVNVLSS